MALRRDMGALFLLLSILRAEMLLIAHPQTKKIGGKNGHRVISMCPFADYVVYS